MSLWAKIGAGVTVFSGLVGLIFNYGPGVLSGSHKINYFFDTFDKYEHVITEQHEEWGNIKKLEAELDSVKTVLFLTMKRDSLIHVIELLNSGKAPYDSIFIESESGHLFHTTITEHFDTRHEE